MKSWSLLASKSQPCHRWRGYLPHHLQLNPSWRVKQLLLMMMMMMLMLQLQ